MLRDTLVQQALEAGKNAEHNLQVIVRNPDKMIDTDKLVNGIAYLNNMIRFAEKEMEIKNARRAGRTLDLRTRLKSLLLSILNAERQKRKGIEL